MSKVQSDGAIEDIVRSVQQLVCSEMHAWTLYLKYVSQLDEGLIDVEDNKVVTAQLEKIDEALDEVHDIAALRRNVMLKLYNMGDGDKDAWCLIKHCAGASYVLFEAYQASDDDRILLDLALEANKLFVRSLSRFLGFELTSCAACFSDMARAKGE